MLDFANIKDYLLLVFFFFYAVLLPGYSLTRAILPPRQLKRLFSYLPGFERGVLKRYFYYLFAPAAGLILLDAVVLLLSKMDAALSFNNYLISFAIINLTLLILNFWLFKPIKEKNKNLGRENYKWIYIIFSLLFIGSLLIRVIFYLPDVVPQDTDLGHHMYWSELYVQKEALPVYNTSEVIEGEHMIFAVMSKLTGITLLSALPLVILSFYNLAMILGLALSVLALTSSRKIALWSLFFSGIYFAIDPPQARYVKGGVIGNTFGNLFIALAFLLAFMFVRYWLGKYIKIGQEKKDKIKPAMASLFSLMLIVIVGSFYTHHLSTLLLGISLVFTIAVWLVLTFFWSEKRFRATFGELADFLKRMLLSPKLLLVLGISLIFPLLVYLPYYLANSAVDTVTQAPIKDTHQGLPLSNLPNKLGWFRLLFLIIGFGEGIFLSWLLLARRYNLWRGGFRLANIKTVSTKLLSILLLLIGWLLPLAILSFAPQVLRIDLPSQRVINYLIFPCALIAAVGADKLFGWIIKNYRNKKIAAAAIIFGLAIIWEGTGDFRSVYKGENKFQEAVELYSASRYLASHTQNDVLILKDHRTIAGDSWIKFFFLRGYDYLVSRTYDYKYNAIDSQLDPCTREMIIVPGSSLSQKCYGQTGINYVIVKPEGDEFLFWKDRGFNAIYLSDSIAIFQIIKH
ncbi:MAG: hypothetical protein V1690_02645 [Candidatus Moraniibacteriota bacterium]